MREILKISERGVDNKQALLYLQQRNQLLRSKALSAIKSNFEELDGYITDKMTRISFERFT